MKLECIKYHGCGNDFICIDGRDQQFSQQSLIAMAKTICERRFNIGADGLIVLINSINADLGMVIINADGSVPEICGNGIRCCVAFALHIGAITSTTFTIQTGSGVKDINVINQSNTHVNVMVSMGNALYGTNFPKKDITIQDDSMINIPYQLNNTQFLMTAISMGNPHAVIFVDNINTIDINALGPESETHDIFPNRVNTEFIQVLSKNELLMRVWERGAGRTLACGSGACAAVVAGILTKRCNATSTVRLEGGDLSISVEPTTFEVTMTGDAIRVFSTTITTDQF